MLQLSGEMKRKAFTLLMHLSHCRTGVEAAGTFNLQYVWLSYTGAGSNCGSGLQLLFNEVSVSIWLSCCSSACLYLQWWRLQGASAGRTAACRCTWLMQPLSKPLSLASQWPTCMA
jgi:hypothetical protein